jgi:hypothetical protein
LPCLRFSSKTGKKVPVSYPENPGTIGEHLKRKQMDSKLLQKDVAKILGVSEDCITIGQEIVADSGVYHF